MSMLSAERTKQLAKDLFELADPSKDSHKEIMEKIAGLLEDAVAQYSEGFLKYAEEYISQNADEVSQFTKDIETKFPSLSSRQAKGLLMNKSSFSLISLQEDKMERYC